MLGPVVMLVLLIWALSRVGRVSREPGCEGKTGFFTLCMVVGALATIIISILSIYMSMSYLASANGIHTTSLNTPLFYVGWTICALVSMVIIDAAAMGGILGSLVRSRDRDQSIKATFLPDAVRHFAPLAGFYLVMGLLLTLPDIPYHILSASHSPRSSWLLSANIIRIREWLLIIPLLLPLLMFAPFGIVTRGLGAFAAIGHSLSVWKSLPSKAIRLTAVGSFFSVITALPIYLSGMMLGRASWLSVFFSPVYAVIGVAAQALITLAVWEFYCANAIVPEAAESFG